MSKILPTALMLLLALVLVTPVALAEDPPATPKPAEGDDTQPAAGDDAKPEAEAKPAGPVITVIEKGTDPKVELRFRPTIGAKMTTETTLNVGFMVSGMGGTMVIRATLDMEIGKGTAEKEYALTGKLTKCAMDDDPNNPMAGQLKPMIDGLQGVTFAGQFNESGKWTTSPAKNMKGVPPQSKQFAAMVAVVFNDLILETPADALGVGGSWSDARSVKAQGSELTSKTTYKVTKIDGKVVTLSFTEERKGGATTLQMMGMQVQVKKVTASGTGSMTLDLANGIATAGAMKTKMTQETESMGNIESTMDGKLTTKVAVPVTTGE